MIFLSRRIQLYNRRLYRSCMYRLHCSSCGRWWRPSL